MEKREKSGWNSTGADELSSPDVTSTILSQSQLYVCHDKSLPRIVRLRVRSVCLFSMVLADLFGMQPFCSACLCLISPCLW